ncbi:MAG: inositol monophosphatase [candidate division Zixibacteria bacterium]|nr:inositol monophosphatase [candidate division Zixibacteria bacterium]
MGKYDDRLKLAVVVAREAGSYLMEVLPQKRSIEKKGIVDIVTEADRHTEKMIFDIINKAFPDDQFLAEEGTSNPGDSAFTWVVDPLDGTTNYSHRFPVFCVSVALVKDGAPLVGCVYNPNLDECFTAHKGEGAYLNDEPIQVSDNDKLIESLLATGFPYDIRESEQDNMNNFYAFYKNGAQGVRRAGSAALDLAYTACGRFDGFWEMKLKPWDIAAGILLVEEAGGKVTNFTGDPVELATGEVLSSNGNIHSVMIEVLARAAKH